MPEFEKDFVMRQVKGISQGLGKFLIQKSVNDILQVKEEDETNGEIFKTSPDDKEDKIRNN